jgi:cyclic-di-GMP-binding protein
MGSNDHSFDVVSEVNFMELNNVVVQVQKELQQRYDFKGSMASIELNQKDKKITLKAENDYKVKALADMLLLKCPKRGISLKALKFNNVEAGFTGGSVQQIVDVQSGLPSDKAKEITKAVKEAKIKVQASIQGEQVRCQSTKIDDLQSAIAFLKGRDFGLDLQFVNYR